MAARQNPLMQEKLQFSRRQVMAGVAAATVLPGYLRAQSPWDAVTEAAQRFDQMHCLVVMRNGEVALAQTFRGPDPDVPVNVKSVSKSVVAALTGAALDRGEIAGIQATLGDIAPSLIPDDADPRVSELTIQNLLTMRAGLERTSGPAYGEWVSSRNWVADALSRSFVAVPGGRMLYSTGSYHVLGAALTEVSGKSLLTLARERLGDPLGIDVPPWTQDPQGYYLGGNEMVLSPVGLARFGEMVRMGGSWQTNRVLSEGWVRATVTPRTRSPYSGLEYGYGWFLSRYDGKRVALARGYGGQIICIMPDLAATIAITSDPARPARSNGYFGELVDFLSGPVVSALQIA